MSPNASMGLMAAGLGMLASRSPYWQNALGEGGLQGLGTYASLTQGDRQYDIKQRELAEQAARDDVLRQHYDNVDNRPVIDHSGSHTRIYYPSTGKFLDTPFETEAFLNRQSTERHQKATEEHQGRLEEYTKMQAEAANRRADRGYEEPLRVLSNPDGTPKLGENGLPQAVWRDRVTGKEEVGTAPDPNVYHAAKNKTPAALQTMQWLVDNNIAGSPQEAWDKFNTAKQSPEARARLVESVAGRLLKNGEAENEQDAREQATKHVNAAISEMTPKPAGASTGAAGIPPPPSGTPPGAQYSPSEKRYYWQENGTWKRSEPIK